MKKRILLTGGGTGGHVFPLAAVVDELEKINYADLEFVYLGPKSALNGEFTDRGIPVHRVASSKLRRYFSFSNFIDVPKFVWSLFQSLFWLYVLMPDAVFSKGGPGALSVVLAARFYMIPIIIHESDAAPGLTNRFSAKFAKRIGVAFETAAANFNKGKVFVSGNPIRAGLVGEKIATEAGKAALGFRKDMDLLFVWGGSQGAERINRFIFNNLETLLRDHQIYHQVGEGNLEKYVSDAEDVLGGMPKDFKEHYHFIGFLDKDGVRTALSAADVVLARAGSGSIFEIAAFGKPSILIPLEGSANDHQKLNAHEYSKNGAAVVLEEANLTPNILSSEIRKILADKAKYAAMGEAARQFSRPEAGKIIAAEILKLLGVR